MYHQSSLSHPPPPPPTLPPLPTNNNSVSKGKAITPDRNALLSQIRGGKTLKKTVTNDRSAPQIKNAKSSEETKTTNNKVSLQNDLLGLGSVFAQGKPKLRPSFKSDKSSAENTEMKQDKMLHPIPNLSKNASSLSSNKFQAGKLNVNGSYQTNKCNTINYPVKVTKPTPPPASLKPSFNVTSTSEISEINKTTSKSTSNIKPLPPPKVLENPSLKFATMHQQVSKIDKIHLGVASPKLPVRNHSSPDNLNELVKSSLSTNNAINISSVKRSTSVGSRQQSQIKAPNYRPPPPPPPAKTSPSVISSVPPPAKMSPCLISSVPPPIPKRSVATLSNLNPAVVNNNPPPPPPLRTTSKNYITGHDFETRFNTNFHKIQEFPLPQYQQTFCKLYISQVEAADAKRQKHIKSEKEMIRSVEC
ncbi:WAS/WASL-interacting protein family member 3-like [Centruroides sculpturatus]|uniref:WAS/WASL-interacting protein family member 3-like n=1 Tax=Centruroides sculpturatus TaxID=218467 RepID=UPI000C6CE26F|nr:WAS/WASL-interacting protein family member 3-like [Centruroides sculpturatus]